MWENFFSSVVLATVAEPLLRRIQKRWRSWRISRTVAALDCGGTVRIRCAARFRNSGGGRHRARLTVTAEGVFLSTVDGAVTHLRLGTARGGVTVVAERSMLVCNAAGRQLEILLPAGEERLFKALVVRALDGGDEHSAAAAAAAAAAAGVVPGAVSGSAPAHGTR
ncbi:hypothetical protein ACFV0T_41460 [Streptomyces sp. NPDC059582]|uniref:hypothetical protein n=1 Tax=Streptomyces sp. NPDC059582 TaxID=3346875 RepID=UPI0036BAAB64